MVAVGRGKETMWERRSRILSRVMPHGLMFGPKLVVDTDFGYSFFFFFESLDLRETSKLTAKTHGRVVAAVLLDSQRM